MYGFLIITGITISIFVFQNFGEWGFVPLLMTVFWYMFGGD